PDAAGGNELLGLASRRDARARERTLQAHRLRHGHPTPPRPRTRAEPRAAEAAARSQARRRAATPRDAAARNVRGTPAWSRRAADGPVLRPDRPRRSARARAAT